jgi:hypothetical protein
VSGRFPGEQVGGVGEQQGEERRRQVQGEPGRAEDEHQGSGHVGLELAPLKERKFAPQDVHRHKAENRLIGIEIGSGEEEEPQGEPRSEKGDYGRRRADGLPIPQRGFRRAVYPLRDRSK